jgi:hypothetical protein
MIASAVPILTAGPASAARVKMIRVADASLIEGDAGSKTLSFSVTWSGSKGGPAPSVAYATTGGTATAGSDFTAKSGTANLSNNGCRCATITVSILGDAIAEGTEAFTIDLSNAQNGTIQDGQATGTIFDNEGPPTLVVLDTSANESSSLSITVALTTASASSVSVDWSAADGTATADDYTASSGSLTFNGGQTTKTVTVPVTADDLDEDDETVIVGLSNPSGASIAQAQSTATIVDDDAEPDVSIGDVTVTEGDTGTVAAVFGLTLGTASGREVAVDVATADGSGTAGVDYVASTTTVTIPAGETSATFEVPVNGDFLNEVDETFTASLSGATNVTIVDGTGVGTISNDDAVPMLSVADANAAEEAGGTIGFVVSLAQPSGTTVTVDYTTSDGTAVAGSDYTATAGTLTFTAGQTTKTIGVPTLTDLVYEGDETFAMTLSNAAGAKIPDAQGLGTISEDDAAPVLSIDDVALAEGTSGTTDAIFTVTLAGATAVDASASWTTSFGSATSADLVASAGTVTIPVGAASTTVSVAVKGDTIDEPNEAFSVTLSDPVAAAIGDGSGAGTILDDDKTPARLTMKVIKTRTTIKAVGLLEPARTGGKVTVTLQRKKGGRWVKVAARTVGVKAVKDRDKDGLKDGSYLAAFARPAKGAYRLKAIAKATSTATSASKTTSFRL